MAHRYTAFIVLSITLSLTAQAQPPVNWERNYGGSELDGFHGMALMPDGGTVAAGLSNSVSAMVEGNNGGVDFWLMRMDAQGNMVWNHNFGGSAEDVAHAVRVGADGNIHVVGHSYSADGFGSQLTELDIVYMRLDPDGVVLHTQRLAGGQGSWPCDVLPLPDGGCLIAATTWIDGAANNADVHLFRLDADGDVVWEERFGGSSYDSAFNMELRPNGELVVATTTRSNDGDVTGHMGFGDGWLLRLDLDGHLIEQRVFGGAYDDQLTRAISTSDGGMVLTGYISYPMLIWGTMQPATRVWATKLSVSGDVQWEHDFGGTMGDYGWHVLPTPDIGYLLFAYAYSPNGDISEFHGTIDAWLIKLNANGNMVWDRSFGGWEIDGPSAILPTPDGGLLLAMGVDAPNAEMSGYLGSVDAWVVKLGGAGVGLDEVLGAAPFIRPDGSGEGYFVDLATGDGSTTMEMLDPSGKAILVRSTVQNNMHLQLGDCAPGVYILRVTSRGQRYTFKLVRA